MKRAAAAAACGLVPFVAAAAGLEFTGNLRFVTRTFLTVRLDDGRVIDCRLPRAGELTASAIAAQYGQEDQVQVACKGIRNELDLSIDRYHSLELTQLRFLRAPTPKEVLLVEASISRQNGENVLQPSAVRGPDKFGALLLEGFNGCRGASWR
jgi:hypothetical protein